MYVISNTGRQLQDIGNYDTHYVYSATSPLCFAAGTLVRTARGEIRVEDLVVGDVALTAGHGSRPIIWIGWGTMLVADANRPVIIGAGAFPDGSPAHDLRLTQGHAVLVGDILIPVGELVNGTSIRWDAAARYVDLFHVALDRHAILIANGTKAESFRDDGNRAGFASQAGTLGKSRSVPTCAPVVSAGPIVERARNALIAHTRNMQAACKRGPMIAQR